MNNIHIPPVVKNLLIINVIFFAATFMFKDSQGGYLLVEKLSVFYFDSPFFKIWQPITYMFMHSPENFMHIFFNMFAVYMFGGVLESRWGAKRFLNFYLITGLGALGLQWAVQAFEVHQIVGTAIPGQTLYHLQNLTASQVETLSGIYNGPMLGASGAVFGLLVAFGMLYPNTELYIMFIPVPIKAKYIIPVYILFELTMGVAQVQGDSVAHYAHLGGALIGFILVKLWKDKDNNRFYTYYE
ncbi:rhomboid family intramembrane serine protease [Pedobacter foliorum]|uniref:rhomboid family intramembrane serine protease n=1 Tax=Pedobacter foliorum TaxID=2739058 RepID=UPI0015645D2F|nr:rhomboid family intramembrane serine protease [Pedobacter foliorum]NRF38925.1 rhomboid family intramembrane serine protease [Pedobacter foliorum]